MRAIILAAGRGERMRPLTDTCPKPLLHVQGKPLIVWHIEALAAAGVRDIVINIAWLSEQFPATLGDGSRWGLRLHYSDESREPVGALETAGGIRKALPLLTAGGESSFWVASADVFVPGFRFEAEAAQRFAADPALDGQLWMVANSPHHPGGDFAISPEGLALSERHGAPADLPRLTWACLGLFKARLFQDLPLGQAVRLRHSLEDAIGRRALAACEYRGPWTDVGTPERLAQLNAPAAG